MVSAEAQGLSAVLSHVGEDLPYSGTYRVSDGSLISRHEHGQGPIILRGDFKVSLNLLLVHPLDPRVIIAPYVMAKTSQIRALIIKLKERKHET